MIALPSSPHGAYRRYDLERTLGSDAVRDALADGTLTLFGRGVLVDARRAVALHTRAAATILLAGQDVALTGFTALAVWGCSAAWSGPIHVVMPYHRRMKRRRDVVVHNGSFERQDVHEVVELPTMALDFALAEVLCRGDRRDALACADQALALTAERERAEFRAAVEERIRTRPDPRGRRRAQRLLGLATGLAESPPESWTMLLFDDAGLPRPTPQHVVCDLSGREIYRLDFAWPDLRIAVEYDGYEAHENRAEKDELRDHDLRRRGWIVIRATSTDLSEPSRLLDKIAAAFRARGMAA